jgi:hypothetical protein
MIEAAIELAGKGMAVFPCKPRGKSPLFQGWQQQATRDLDAVRAMWTATPAANIGIATGAASGIWVLDIDGEDGEQSLVELELEHGDLPATVETITGGGGRHLLFRMSRPIANSVGFVGRGLDVKGDGGLIVAPPSIHPNGRAYRWSVDNAKEFAHAPAWLLAAADTRHVSANDTCAQKPKDFWETLIREGAPDGQRNDLLAKLAGRLLSPYPLTRSMVLELLHAEPKLKPCSTAFAEKRAYNEPVA